MILFVDHNEHTYDGPLGRALADTEGLRLQEAVLCHTGKRTGATFFRGSKPVDGLWVSSDIEIANVCVMPFGYGISSELGLHFGHYIVGCKSDIVVHYHTARVLVVLAHAIQLERWSRGLLVMLEKMLGVTLVSKLRWRWYTRQSRPASQTGETSSLPQAAPSNQLSAFT